MTPAQVRFKKATRLSERRALTVVKKVCTDIEIVTAFKAETLIFPILKVSFIFNFSIFTATMGVALSLGTDAALSRHRIRRSDTPGLCSW